MKKTLALHGNADVCGERRLSCYLSPFDAPSMSPPGRSARLAARRLPVICCISRALHSHEMT